MSNSGHRESLPAGNQLHWYRIERVLGQGGFGLTYLAHDINLDRDVAVKEYMPGQISTRESDLSVHPHSKEHETDFRWGLERFIKEARILIRNNGSPVLLDFGSARQARSNNYSKTLTNFISPGYAPIEQYASKGERQGPWTDIYGLGATAYEAISGNRPESAIDRSAMISQYGEDSLIRISQLCSGGFSEKFLAAIDHALAFRTLERPQSISEWRNEFDVDQERVDTVRAGKIEAGPEIPYISDQQIQPLPHTFTRLTDLNPHIPNVGNSGNGIEELIPTLRAAVVKKRRIISIATTSLCMVILSGIGYTVLIPGSVGPAVSDDINGNTTITKGIEETSSIVPADKEKIQRLLVQARENIKAMRLTTPKNNNAFDEYRSILAIDNGNIEALRGIELISDKYIEMVYENLKANNLERAGNYVAKAEIVSPGIPKVMAARKDVDKAVNDDRNARGVSDTIAKWFKKALVK